jgi:hypothetical protein
MTTPYILQGKLKVYGLEFEDTTFIDFYFNLESVNAFYMGEEDLISIVIGGQIYELEYNKNLYKTIKKYFTAISLN